MRKGLKHFTAKKKKSNTEEHNLGNEGPRNLEGMQEKNRKTTHVKFPPPYNNYFKYKRVKLSNSKTDWQNGKQKKL